MAKSRYEQVWDGEWFWMPKTLDLACCACGLVHNVKFRVRKGRLEACFTTDNRKTAQLRRHAPNAGPLKHARSSTAPSDIKTADTRNARSVVQRTRGSGHRARG